MDVIEETKVDPITIIERLKRIEFKLPNKKEGEDGKANETNTFSSN